MNHQRKADFIRASLIVVIVFALVALIGYWLNPTAWLPLGIFVLIVVVLIAALIEEYSRPKIQ
jgi:hypothetical protein